MKTISFLVKEFDNVGNSIPMTLNNFADMRDFILMNKFKFYRYGSNNRVSFHKNMIIK